MNLHNYYGLTFATWSVIGDHLTPITLLTSIYLVLASLASGTVDMELWNPHWTSLYMSPCVAIV